MACRFGILGLVVVDAWLWRKNVAEGFLARCKAWGTGKLLLGPPRLTALLVVVADAVLGGFVLSDREGWYLFPVRGGYPVIRWRVPAGFLVGVRDALQRPRCLWPKLVSSKELVVLTCSGNLSMVTMLICGWLIVSFHKAIVLK